MTFSSSLSSVTTNRSCMLACDSILPRLAHTLCSPPRCSLCHILKAHWSILYLALCVLTLQATWLLCWRSQRFPEVFLRDEQLWRFLAGELPRNCVGAAVLSSPVNAWAEFFNQPVSAPARVLINNLWSCKPLHNYVVEARHSKSGSI